MIWLRCFTCIILLFNFCTPVTSQANPDKFSWDLQRNETQQIVQKFLMYAESYLMQNCGSRHTTIIAQKNYLLKAAALIFESRPYFVVNNWKGLVESREYAKENCVFVFIDTMDYYYLSTIFGYLPIAYYTKVQVVSTISLGEEEIQNIFHLTYDKSIENVTITFLENNEFKAFQVFPYTKDCRREVRLLYVWALDKGFQTYNYNDYSPRNLNKCPVLISTLLLEDAIALRENSDGTLQVLGGPEGYLILTFAEKLNFTAAVKYPEIQDWEGIVNNTMVGLLGDIKNRKSLIAFGQLRPTLNRHKYSDFTKSYGHQCIVWTTPVITTSTDDILCSEFGTYLWVAVVFSIVFSCVYIYNISRISSTNRGRETCIEVTLNMICSTLGIPLHCVPANRPSKIYYMSYIFYAMVLTVAYRTSLASILTVRNNAQLIKTDEDIIRSGLATGGSKSIQSILQSQQEESPNIPYLIEHYEIVPNITSALDRIKHKKDLAYIRHLSTMQYYKRNLTLSGEDVYFYSFDECIISYHEIACVSKGSALTDELNDIIERMWESGFIDYWNRKIGNFDIHKDCERTTMKEQKLTLSQLRSIFVLQLSGTTLAILTMILEMIFGALLKQKFCI